MRGNTPSNMALPMSPVNGDIREFPVSSSEVLVLDLADWLQEGRSLCLLSPPSND